MLTDAQLDAIFAEFKVEIVLRPEKATRTFQTFDDFRMFFQVERTFWNEVPIPEVSSAFNEIFTFLAQSQGDVNTARTNISRVVNIASNTNSALIYSSTARAKFLKSLGKNTQAIEGAWGFFRGNIPFGYDRGPLGSSAGFYGLVAALFQSNPGLLSAGAAAEAQAFSEQRARTESFRGEIENRFDKLKRDADEWQTSNQDAATSLLAEKKAAFENEHARQIETFGKAEDDWTKRFTHLEELYSEKLRLQEPAKYWRDLERQYVIQGRWWIVGTASIVGAVASWITHLVYQPPDILMSDKFTLGGLKGTLLIAAGVSAFLYFMNLFVKVATSSFHLARDARERYQLTHVFLALVKDSAIEAKDREVILSALFSRSDTGLLKGDSTPTLQSPLISIIENLRK